MSEGHFIGLGDKTTCGGEVLDGDNRINFYGLLHAYDGDRVSCGKDKHTYPIVGGIAHINNDGRLMAGTLDSHSGCPCKARLIPSVYTATYESRNMAPRTSSGASEPIADSPQVALSHNAYNASNTATLAAFNGVQGEDPGFYIVPQSTSREALEATLFPAIDPAVMRKFQALNPNMGTVKAGSLIVLSDPNNSACTYQEAQLMRAAQQVEASLESLTPEEADFVHRHGPEIAGFIGHGSTWLGVSAVVMEKHLSNLRGTLLGYRTFASAKLSPARPPPIATVLCGSPAASETAGCALGEFHSLARPDNPRRSPEVENGPGYIQSKPGASLGQGRWAGADSGVCRSRGGGQSCHEVYEGRGVHRHWAWRSVFVVGG